MKINNNGFDKRIDNLVDETSIISVLKNEAIRVQGDAKIIVPVDTGSLRNSIHIKQGENNKSVIVYTTIEYASYVEFGTRFQKEKPFLRPALSKNRETIIKNIKEFLTKEIKRNARR